MMQLRALALCLIAYGAFLAPARANVDLIIEPSFGSTERTGSTASVAFDFGGSRFGNLLTITLRNTTPLELGSRLTAVGLELPDFLVDRPAIIKAEMDSYFDTLTFDHRISPGWLNAENGYDLVLSSDGDFLGGNPNGAPEAGEHARIILTLGETGFSPQQLAGKFEEFYDGAHQPFVIGRFQSVGHNGELSDKVAGGVPEPATLMLLAVGAIMATRRSPRRD